MASSEAPLALASFVVPIRNSNESVPRLQRLLLLANSLERQDAGSPKEWNPRRPPKSREAAPKSQTREVPPQSSAAGLGSTRRVPHEAQGGHPEVESLVVV